MSHFSYFQKEGGEEGWKIAPTEVANKMTDAMFVTVLGLSPPPTEDTTKEEYAAIKYAGPMYFDLDDSASPASTARHMLTLVEALMKLDVREESMALYASGGKGFHLTIAPEIFIDKVAKAGYAALPAIYKEVAFQLAVPSMDFRVYTARKGRMFRMPNIKRPNGMYKVQITVDELRKIAGESRDAAEAAYKELCSTPRETWLVSNEPRAFGLQAKFEAAKRKVEGAVRKAAKQKPVELPDELPSFEAMLRGEGLHPDAGFHQIALQVTITAHARGMTCEELVQAAEGLVQSHSSDGARYNTPDKRRFELRRMYDYTEDNPCYAYGAGAIRALLSHSAPDLAGIKVTAEEVQDAIDNPAEGDDYGHAGVILTTSGVSIPVEGGAKQVLALNFADATEMVSSVTGNASVLQATIAEPGTGRILGSRTFELDQFNSASALNKAVMPMGQVFTGNDNQARGVYLRLVEKARNSGRRIYVVNREGVDIVSLPFHTNEAVQKGVLIFADRDNVLTSREAAGYEDFNLKFVGFPDPKGIYKSDLSLSPRMKDLDANSIETLRQTMHDFVKAQTPAYMGKLIGWMTACHYRMMFHKVYDQFPLLHVNGAAGAGKTSMVKLAANLHYYRQEPKMLTPSSTSFAIKEAAAASASIPLVIDEYKPHEMATSRHDEFKLLFRDAYNCREVTRGGGTRDSSDYRAIQSVQLAAPICFIAEAAESEPAVMERVVLLTLVKASSIRNEEFFTHYMKAKENKHTLGIIGAFLARNAVNAYTVETLKKEFDEIYTATRKELMLQPGEEGLSFKERQQKTNAKERTVFNYAVLRFGLIKFASIAEKILESDPDKERRAEIMSALDEMYTSATSSVNDLQSQTMPEWLKVLNALADMANSNPYNQWALNEGKDYLVYQDGETPTLELNVRSCYAKYRFYCAAKTEKALFSSDLAFTHALKNLPANLNAARGNIICPGGSQSFNLDDLRLLGFIDMPEKGGRK